MSPTLNPIRRSVDTSDGPVFLTEGEWRALCGEDGIAPASKDVLIHRVRKKLAPYGVRVSREVVYILEASND